MNFGRQLARILGAAIVLIAASLAPSPGQAHEGHAHAARAGMVQAGPVASAAGALTAAENAASINVLMPRREERSDEPRSTGDEGAPSASSALRGSAPWPSHLRMRGVGEGALASVSAHSVGPVTAAVDHDTPAPAGCDGHCCGAGAACCAPALAPPIAGLGPMATLARAVPLPPARAFLDIDPEALPEPPRPIA